MSWIRRRPLTALAALAFALRAACALATEFRPIFPPYYYTDAHNTHAAALRALADVEAGRAPVIDGSLSERVQTAISLGVYRALGPRPLAVKLFNALLGALAVAALARAFAAAFPPRAALAAALAAAVWPSHVFYTSQHLKEAPVAFFAYAALAAALAAVADGISARRRAALAAVAAAALLGAGIYRSYVLVCLAGAILIALGLAAARPPRSGAVLAAAAVLSALALYRPASRRLLASFESTPQGAADTLRVQPNLLPVTYDYYSGMRSYRPTSPEGISGFRRVRQHADRKWAEVNAGREIGTQIYPDAEFSGWLDVLLFLPKGAFAVLFMPLPGFYPMEGKLGRWAAAAENVLLLAIAALAAAGVARGPAAPGRLCLIVFFAAMTAGSALLEFDLGSAGRHKLLYLPMLFPFAAEAAARLLGAEEPS